MALCLALRMALLLLSGVLAPAVLTGKGAPGLCYHQPPKAKKYLRPESLMPTGKAIHRRWGGSLAVIL